MFDQIKARERAGHQCAGVRDLERPNEPEDEAEQELDVNRHGIEHPDPVVQLAPRPVAQPAD